MMIKHESSIKSATPVEIQTHIRLLWYNPSQYSHARCGKFCNRIDTFLASHWHPSKLTDLNTYFDEDSSSYPPQNTRVGMCRIARMPMPR